MLSHWLFIFQKSNEVKCLYSGLWMPKRPPWNTILKFYWVILSIRLNIVFLRENLIWLLGCFFIHHVPVLWFRNIVPAIFKASYLAWHVWFSFEYRVWPRWFILNIYILNVWTYLYFDILSLVVGNKSWTVFDEESIIIYGVINEITL